MSTNKSILSFRETIEFLDCGKGFLRSLIDDGAIKPHYVRTRIYFCPMEIYAYIKNCPTVKPGKTQEEE
jgi:hypothetical protein